MKRKQWQSSLGFILASAGAAIGLGNIQRFPYVVAEHGGGAFLVIYLLCIFLIGIPLMLAEFCIGRMYRKNPYLCLRRAYQSLGPFKYISMLPIFVAFFILTYYIVLSAWTMGFSVHFLFDSSTNFRTITSNASLSIFYTMLFYIFTGLIVAKGINKGIERSVKLFIPLLVFFLFILLITSLSLPNSSKGVYFFLSPDLKKINLDTIFYALGQAFFSLCIGEGVLMTYGSYAKRSENLVRSTLSIICFDTFVAILSGLIIFPALFSFGQSTHQGPELVFQVLPQLFLKLPYGKFLQVIFFLMLCFAALTTCISLLEVCVNFLLEKTPLKRYKAILIVCGCACTISLPIALSKSSSATFSRLNISFLKTKDLYQLMDLIWGNIGMILSGLLTAIACGWFIQQSQTTKEISKSSPHFKKWSGPWLFTLRYICPICLLLLLFNILSQ